MRVAEFAVLYLLVGAGCALVLLARRGDGRRRWAEAPLVVLFWPLYGPFLLAGGSSVASGGPEERAFVEALSRVEGTPLASLLPDRSTVRVLSRRLSLAHERIGEIDRLLAQPEFSAPDAQARQEAFVARGDARAAAAAQSRLQNIARLRTLRDRFARELDEVRELLGQLRVQAEVVRLSGTAEAGSRELVAEILSRVEGLDAVLAEDAVA